ncbi:DUF2690 domain-containing protein [Streptomyces camelliae]|uniref:DUF2690 domain-containing protein n=1 Tax=Streptomyces camelliae TaxID=3004093 RepID=A0ABY7PF72_9ACTN|nr:DUF2690 domain-containing protein [Streptomyces sp. HUAS 2-6]WBO69271.1 DUF2690 domain-containing protein [Streptomyces sp. HUAS 2-6]
MATLAGGTGGQRPTAVRTAGAGTASATPGCSGAGCDGLDPKITGCDRADTSTIKDGWAGTMHLEIRYSRTCHTVWGKLTGAEAGDTVEIRTSPTRRLIAKVDTGHTNYKAMLSAPARPDFTAQAAAVAVNPVKREVARGHVMTVGAGATDLTSATPAPTGSTG